MKLAKKAQLTLAKNNFTKLQTDLNQDKKLQNILKDPEKLPQNYKKKPIQKPKVNFFEKALIMNKNRRKIGYEMAFSHRTSGNIDFTEYSLYAYGNEAFLLGYLQDDYSSLDLIYERLEAKKPGAIVLSEMSMYELEKLILGDKFFDYPIKIDMSDEKQFCRKIMHKFYGEIKKSHPDFYLDQRVENPMIFSVDYESRRRKIHVPLSIGIWGSQQRNMPIILAAPHPLLVHEDLCLSFELQELQEMWHKLNKIYIEEYFYEN